MDGPGARIFKFSAYELSLIPLGLSKGGMPVKLPMQPLRLLALLVERAGELVTHEDIRKIVWNGRTVDFNSSVPVCVRQIRTALGDTAERPSFIETVPRQGYRFLGAVTSTRVPIAASRTPNSSRVRPLTTAAAAVGAIAVALVLWLALAGGTMEASAARDSYLRGHYLVERGGRDNAERSVRFFLEALAKDAGYAPAHVGLAEAYRAVNKADDSKVHALKAVALAPQSADAHVQLAISLMHSDWDWDGAGRHLERALALDPQASEARYISAGRHAILGNLAAALADMDIALERDPVSTLLRADYGWFLYYNGDYDKAIARCREALALDAKHAGSLSCVERAALAKGDHAASRDAALALMKLWGAPKDAQHKVSALPAEEAPRAFHEWRLAFFLNYPDPSAITGEDLADASAAAGDYGRAMAALERAADAKGTLLPYMLSDPIFTPLRTDPRFAALRARLNLSPVALAN